MSKKSQKGQLIAHYVIIGDDVTWQMAKARELHPGCSVQKYPRVVSADGVAISVTAIIVRGVPRAQE